MSLSRITSNSNSTISHYNPQTSSSFPLLNSMRFFALLPLLGAVALASPMPEADSSELSARADSWSIDFFKDSSSCGGDKLEHKSESKESGCVKVKASDIGSYKAKLGGWFLSVYTTDDCSIKKPSLPDTTNPGGPVEEFCHPKPEPWGKDEIKSYKVGSRSILEGHKLTENTL